MFTREPAARARRGKAEAPAAVLTVGNAYVHATSFRAVRALDGEGPAGIELEECLNDIGMLMVVCS